MSSLQKFHRRTNAGIANLPPVVGSALVNQSSTTSSVLSYTFPVNTFTDPDVGDVLTYTATGLPSGITFNASTRTFSGTGTTVGTYTVTVTATDTKNASVSQSFTISILPGIGSGNDTKGYYLGTAGDGTSLMYVAPKSTEVQKAWGSQGSNRGTVSGTAGLTNTNTLAGYGNLITAGHPAAYYCKNLTTGGYNTWYLPASAELTTLYSNRLATPFATANAFVGDYCWSSSETNLNTAFARYMASPGYLVSKNKNEGLSYVRAVRRSIS
jgi:hypothetical protein